MLKKIKDLIEAYFYMIDGENIEDYLKEIIFLHKDIEIKITYKALKHIVEQRKKDTYTIETIYSIFIILHVSLTEDNYRIIQNKDTYIFTENIYADKKGVFIVLELTPISKNSYYIRTAFFRLVSKIQKYIQKLR